MTLYTFILCMKGLSTLVFIFSLTILIVRFKVQRRITTNKWTNNHEYTIA